MSRPPVDTVPLNVGHQIDLAKLGRKLRISALSATRIGGNCAEMVTLTLGPNVALAIANRLDPVVSAAPLSFDLPEGFDGASCRIDVDQVARDSRMFVTLVCFAVASDSLTKAFLAFAGLQ